MNIVEMPVPSQGGHPFLLPFDYDELTADGQREARINACAQWRLPRAPHLRAEAQLAAFLFFHHFYLCDEPDVGFYSGFFDEPPLPFAPFHLDIIRANASYPLNVVAAPRGSAKSTLLSQLRLMKLVSWPMYSISTAFGGSRLVKRFGTQMMLQIDNNSRLNDDFAASVGGKLRPPRGKAPFSNEMMFLTNGSWTSHTTTRSFQRGDRPYEFHMDDPEYDPEGESTSMQRLRSEIEMLIFKLIIPMVARDGRSLTWVGTTISRAHLLYKALQSEGEGFGYDKRFRHWNRMRLKALYTLEDGSELSIWPEMWSIPKLQLIKDQIGPAQFQSEYLNNPGAGEGQYFFLDQRHAYDLVDPDIHLTEAPYQSSTTIKWTRKGESISMPLSEFLSQNSVFVTVDSAPTSTSTSDYNAVVVMAITPYNELFILDVFNRRVKEHITALQALRFADKWRASVIGVELHSKSQGVYGALQHMLGTRAESVEEFDHLPSLRPLRVGYAAKTARISSMQYRFGDPNVTDPTQHGYGGLIKYPLNSPIIRNREWQDLVTQTEQFSPDAADGGLENDDVLDAVAMHQDVVVGLRKKPSVRAAAPSVIQQLKDGKRFDDHTPLAFRVNWAEISREDMDQIIEAGRRLRDKPKPNESQA